MSQTSPSNTSPLDKVRSFVETLVRSDFSNADIVRELAKDPPGPDPDLPIYTSEKSVRRALKRWGISRADVARRRQSLGTPGVKIDGDKAEAISKPATTVVDHEELIRSRGLKTDEWEVERLTVNEWDSPTGETLNQLKVSLKRVVPRHILYPARTDGVVYHDEWLHKTPSLHGQPTLVVFTGDQQAPFHDPLLHELFCEWLGRNEPDKGVLIGDTVDFPEISRYRNNPEWTAKTQECIDAGYSLLRDYVSASSGTKWVKLHGNHDDRIRNQLIDQLADLYGLRRALVPDAMPEPGALSMTNLLRLDELGIELIADDGPYEHAQYKVSQYLAARHGWIVKKRAGESAIATLEHLGYSIVCGHTHRQSLVHKTLHDIDGKPTTYAAAETGCMCQVEDGLGYTVAPDWQNGFATAQVWPDGTFKIDLATFVEGRLLWRDQLHY